MIKMKKMSRFLFAFILFGFIAIINVKAEVLNAVNLEIHNPTAGDIVTIDEGGMPSPLPFVAPMEAGYVIDANIYRTSIPDFSICEAIVEDEEKFACINDTDTNSIFSGEFLENQEYLVEVSLSAAMPDYEFDADAETNNVAITINDETGAPLNFQIVSASNSNILLYATVQGKTENNQNEDEQNINENNNEEQNIDVSCKLSEFRGNNKELTFTYSGSTYVNRPNIYSLYEEDPITHTYNQVQGKGKLGLENYYEKEENKNFTFKVTGNDLEDEKKYQINIKSDYVDKKLTYTGSKLKQGVTIELTEKETYGEATFTISEGNNIIKIKDGSCENNSCNPDTYESIIIDFGRTYFDYSKLDKIYNELAKNGVIELNCVDPGDNDFSDSMITSALPTYDEYSLYGSIQDGKGILQIQLIEDYNIYKSYDVEYKFLTKNENIGKIVSEVAKKINFTWEDLFSDFDNRFVVEDLESLNYLYNVQKSKNQMAAINSIVNYSSKIHKISDNVNVDFMFDTRAGGSESTFYETVVGPMNILYDGIIYDNINPVGYSLSKIIYIPSDTENTREAFIAAAKKRINDYMKDVNVEITYGGKISDLDDVQYSWDKYNATTDNYEYTPLFDLNKTNGEWYNIKIGDKVYTYFIVKDDSKMNVPYVKTIDTNTNIYIVTDSFDAPLDSRISATKLDKNSSEYKALAKKLNIIKGLAFDLKLYSTSLEMYVSKLSNGNFKVYIPIDEETAKKTLVAVYVKDDGTIEEHPITIENGYAVFETNHFSTYSITEATKVTNPKTGDNIITYISMLGLSLIGLIIVRLNIKRKKLNI